MKRGRPKKTSPDVTLSDLGISRKQSSDWQKLAEIPADEFEEYLALTPKPSTQAALRRFGKLSQDPKTATKVCPTCGRPL
jgi:hypothetical protein